VTSEGAETPDIGRRGGLADYHLGNLVDDPELTLHPHRHRAANLRVAVTQRLQTMASARRRDQLLR
jgi:hypothetical protein